MRETARKRVTQKLIRKTEEIVGYCYMWCCFFLSQAKGCFLVRQTSNIAFETPNKENEEKAKIENVVFKKL